MSAGPRSATRGAGSGTNEMTLARLPQKSCMHQHVEEIFAVRAPELPQALCLSERQTEARHFEVLVPNPARQGISRGGARRTHHGSSHVHGNPNVARSTLGRLCDFSTPVRRLALTNAP